DVGYSAAQCGQAFLCQQRNAEQQNHARDQRKSGMHTCSPFAIGQLLGRFDLGLHAIRRRTRLRRMRSAVVRVDDIQHQDVITDVVLDRILPTATGSSYTGTTGTSVSALVNNQFQFLDVGVNVDITPKIHGTDEVSLHLDLNISNVTDYVHLGGSSEQQIGQRKESFDVRMKQGEANVLGGLMQTQQSKTMSGTPGLASVPVLRCLFSRESTENSVSELLFVLIPHIVRAQEITETNVKGIASGSD